MHGALIFGSITKIGWFHLCSDLSCRQDVVEPLQQNLLLAALNLSPRWSSVDLRSTPTALNPKPYEPGESLAKFILALPWFLSDSSSPARKPRALNITKICSNI